MNLETTNIEEQGTWDAIASLINRMIKSKVNTCMPCEVTGVNKDKVSVRSLVIQKEANYPPVIYHNVMVMMPQAGGLKILHPVSVGDQGLLLTCKLDISEFKKTRVASKTTNGRVFDCNDSVFIPLHANDNDLTKQEVTVVYNEKAGEDATRVVISEEGVELKTKAHVKIATGQVRFAIDGNSVLIHPQDGSVEVIADEIVLQSRTIKSPALKKVIDALRDLMDAISQGMKGGATAPVEYQAQKPLKEQDFRILKE